eukprot:5494229-Pyramimonas_sp.AAC.1
MGGLSVVRTRAGVPLEIGDVLLPSPTLLDIRDVWAKDLPFECTFWRVRRDAAGVSVDPVTHRCPIFSDALGASPASALALDVLHTVHLGVTQRLGSAILWRIVEANVYNKRSVSQRVRAMEADMHTWYQHENIPHEQRMGRLTC